MFDSQIKKVGKNFILIVFTIITILLTYLSLFLNAYTSVDEKTTIVLDNPFKVIGWFIIVLIAFYFVRKFFNTGYILF